MQQGSDEQIGIVVTGCLERLHNSHTVPLVTQGQLPEKLLLRLRRQNKGNGRPRLLGQRLGRDDLPKLLKAIPGTHVRQTAAIPPERQMY